MCPHILYVKLSHRVHSRVQNSGQVKIMTNFHLRNEGIQGIMRLRILNVCECEYTDVQKPPGPIPWPL